MIVQGVYELFDKEQSTDWGDDERINRLVFIGQLVQLHVMLKIPTLILLFSLQVITWTEMCC